MKTVLHNITVYFLAFSIPCASFSAPSTPGRVGRESRPCFRFNETALANQAIGARGYPLPAATGRNASVQHDGSKQGPSRRTIVTGGALSLAMTFLAACGLWKPKSPPQQTQEQEDNLRDWALYAAAQLQTDKPRDEAAIQLALTKARASAAVVAKADDPEWPNTVEQFMRSWIKEVQTYRQRAKAADVPWPYELYDVLTPFNDQFLSRRGYILFPAGGNSTEEFGLLSVRQRTTLTATPKDGTARSITLWQGKIVTLTTVFIFDDGAGAITFGSEDRPVIVAPDERFFGYSYQIHKNLLNPNSDNSKEMQNSQDQYLWAAFQEAFKRDHAIMKEGWLNPLFIADWRRHLLVHEMTHAMTLGSPKKPLMRSAIPRWEALGITSELDSVNFSFVRLVELIHFAVGKIRFVAYAEKKNNKKYDRQTVYRNSWELIALSEYANALARWDRDNASRLKDIAQRIQRLDETACLDLAALIFNTRSVHLGLAGYGAMSALKKGLPGPDEWTYDSIPYTVLQPPDIYLRMELNVPLAQHPRGHHQDRLLVAG